VIPERALLGLRVDNSSLGAEIFSFSVLLLV